MSDTFKALVLTQEDGKTVSNIKQLSNDDLPEGDVLLAVDYSSLNYKDGLAITGKGKIVRQWPLVPGIDLSGTVLESASASGCSRNGWCRCPLDWTANRRWRSVPPDSPPCFAS